MTPARARACQGVVEGMPVQLDVLVDEGEGPFQAHVVDVAHVPAGVAAAYDLKARAIAERWSENNGEAVAREMAGLLVDDGPGVASLGSETLARQIRNGIGWRYGEPSCDRDGGCNLTATASSEIIISVPFVVSKTVMVELPFRLDIDARGAVASGAATVMAEPQIGAAEIVGR